MSFDWASFSDVGFHLFELSDEESYQRSAVGRLYYSIFGLSKEYYEKTHKKCIPSINGHKILANALSDSVYSEEHYLGKCLFNLKKCRVNADYHNNFNNKYVEESKKMYNDAIEILDYLDNNPVVPKF